MKRPGPKERKKRIITILRERKKVPVSALEHVLQVPASTIRRDLRELVQEGLVTRSHGAVELKKTTASLLPDPEESFDSPLVGCYLSGTAEMLSDSQFLFAGVGHMPEEIVKSLQGKEVVTNSLGVAIAAAQGNTVTVIGETLQRDTYTLSARNWLPFLTDRIFETVLIEAEGFDERYFYASEEQFWLLKEILQLSRKTVLICRSARFGKANSRRLSFRENVHRVLTDMVEFPEKVNGKQHWEGIEVVDIHTYAPRTESPDREDATAPDEPGGGQDKTDAQEGVQADVHEHKADSLPDKKKVVGNVVFPDKARWSEGKHE